MQFTGSVHSILRSSAKSCFSIFHQHNFDIWIFADCSSLNRNSATRYMAGNFNLSWQLTGRTGRWILLAISLLWLLLLHGKVLLHPDDYVFSGKGDGLKNYYTFIYHVRHDESWLTFTGNNFPFGEHVCYTDSHPIVSLTMGWIPWVQSHPVALINLLMLLSIPFTSLVLYELLRLYKVRIALCIAGALCINWMNPQIYRFLGHLALSYAWIIPLGLIIIHKFRNANQNVWSVVYFVYCVIVWLIHPYLGFALGLLAGANFLVEGIYLTYRRSIKSGWLIYIACMTFLPLIMYLTFIKLTDTHVNRPPDAKGYLQYSSSFESIFLPNHGPLKQLLGLDDAAITQSWEGWAYLGIAVILIVFTAVVFYGKRLLSYLKENTEWIFLILSASFVALFACGFPFKQGNESWLDIIPYIEQFRAPGRFAWILYYTLTVFAFVLIDRWMQISKVKSPAHIPVALVVVALFVVEGFDGQREVANLISEEHNMYNTKFLTDKDKERLAKLEVLQKNGKVAMLPLPYFHYGSDYYLFEGSNEAKRDAHTLSFHSGIPMMANVNPRVSLSESQSLIQMIAPDYFVKNIWSQVDSDLQVFVIASGGEMNRVEQKFLKNYGEVFTFSQQKEEYETMKQTLAEASLLPDTAFDRDYYYYNSFDNEAGGKKSGTTIPFLILDTLSGDNLAISRNWVASAWLYFNDPDAQTTAITVERYRGDSVLWVGRTHVATSHFQFQDSLFVEVPFEVEPGWNYRIFSKGSETDWADIQIDHLMVKPEGVDLIQKMGDHVRFNNFPFK